MKIRFVVWLMAAVPLFAQGNRWWAWPADPDPQVAERGRAEFARACGNCHAPNATGTKKGPDLIRTALVRHDKDGSAIAALVRNGHPAKGMPAIAMTDVQMKDLVAYIQWVVQKYDRVSPGPPPDDYPVELLLTGNADAGKAFFNGAGGCNGCHSVTGDLAGIAKKYPPVFLQSRFLMPRATKPRLATVTLASGEKVIGELKTINTYDVVIQEAGGKPLTFVADDVKVEVRDPLAPHRALLPKYTDADVHNMFAYLWSLQ